MGKHAVQTMPITLRPMLAADLPLLHRWLNQPHVAQWWGTPGPSLHEVKAHYLPRVMALEAVTPYIAVLETPQCPRPFAYLQSYVTVASGGGWWEHITDPGVRGIDQSIGEPDLLNLGLGTRMVRALVDLLFADPAVTAIQTDPSPHNQRAIRCCEKAGFQRVADITTPDGPALYMLCQRP